jgi:predicted HAD superfamily Cof-like phosphohydrolase
MVGFANTTAHKMMDHLFMTYGNITAVDLENNFEQMHRAWDPQQPVESLFKKIQNCADYPRREVFLLGIHIKSMLDMQKSLQLGTL